MTKIQSEIDVIVEHLTNKAWRMRNLYKIQPKEIPGLPSVVNYIPNQVQEIIMSCKHKRKIIPKSRQHGVTTHVAIHYLDEILFNPLMTASIIAHREADALKIFSKKIKFVYEHIDEKYKPFIPSVVRESRFLYEFSNESVISADTTVRSTTLNYLHVSELSQLYFMNPERANEVKTGGFPAAEYGEISIESTMKGRLGIMYELCEKAKAIKDSKRELSSKDFAFLFFGWQDDPNNRLFEDFAITQTTRDYANKLKEDHSIELDEAQMRWYQKTHDLLGDDMKQEHPTTYEESVENTNEGTYFSKQLNQAYQDNRICYVAYDSYANVYASFDIGRSDSTAIWVFQLIQGKICYIDYFEADGEDPGFYHNWLESRVYKVRTVVLPHDAKAKSPSASESYEDIFLRLGYEVYIPKRDDHEINGINKARNAFNLCYFDEMKCDRGIECLQKFRKEYDNKHDCYRTKSVHDQYSDGAKSFIYSIQGAELINGGSSYSEALKKHKKAVKERKLKF